MREKEPLEELESILLPPLGDILRQGMRWSLAHPVASKRAYNLINSLPGQPEDRQQRIIGLVTRLYFRP